MGVQFNLPLYTHFVFHVQRVRILQIDICGGFELLKLCTIGVNARSKKEVLRSPHGDLFKPCMTWINFSIETNFAAAYEHESVSGYIFQTSSLIGSYTSMTISPLQEPSLTEIFVSDSVSKLLFLGNCGCSNHGRWFVLDQHAKCSHYLLLIWFMLAILLDFAMLPRMAVSFLQNSVQTWKRLYFGIRTYLYIMEVTQEACYLK
jgi:hypothetical protein